jgi:hypothetical protein
MSLGTLMVVNKSGGVIYTRDVSPVPRLPANEYLRLGSTFASLHTIAKQLSPLPGSGGIAVVEAPGFSLHCLETPTGLKFFVTALPRGAGAGAGGGAPRPGAPAVSAFLFAVYRLYADFALKSPFSASRARSERRGAARLAPSTLTDPRFLFASSASADEIDMPIRTRLFDHGIDAYVVANGLGTGGAAVAAAAGR